jgi:hypothetical protein
MKSIFCEFIFLSFLCCLFTRHIHGGFQHISSFHMIAKHKNDNKIPKCGTILSKALKIRGGSDALIAKEIVAEEKETVVQIQKCAILVSTTVGSVFLDKKKRLTVDSNSTIAELKCLIEKKFPGLPPTGLQKLFLGIRPLRDEEMIGNITTTSPTPILLDMLSGTSVYNRTLSISQALEAHAASIVQQAYLGAKLRASFEEVQTSILSGGIGSNNDTLVAFESGLYRDMFDAVNRTLYETYADDIAEALEREREPGSIQIKIHDRKKQKQ